jgi:hypothetical protein
VREHFVVLEDGGFTEVFRNAQLAYFELVLQGFEGRSDFDAGWGFLLWAYFGGEEEALFLL